LKEKKAKRRRDEFWRAATYLRPHLKIVVISVLCALLVGATLTGGLGTILPVMRVLINDETVGDYVNRKIVEKRLGIRLTDDAGDVRIARIEPGSPLLPLGVQPGQALSAGQEQPRTERASRTLSDLADPWTGQAQVRVNGRSVLVPLAPLPWHYIKARQIADLLPAGRVHAIAAVLGFVIVLAVVGNIVRFFQEYLAEKAAILTVRDIRVHVYDHSLRLQLNYFGRHGTSDITSRLTQDAMTLQEGLKSMLGSFIQEPIKAAGAFGLALFASWHLTLFIVLFGPVMFVLIRKFGKTIRRAARAALERSSTMLGQVEGSLVGLRVVKAANAERHERRRFRRIVDSLIHEQLRIARMEAFSTPALELMTLIVVCGIVLGASYMVLVLRKLDVETFFLVMACLMMIGESLRKVSKINNVLQRSNAAAGRLFELLNQPGETPRRWRGGRDLVERPRKELPPIEREVRFENVSFSYPGAKHPAVSGVSLAVPKGLSVAVVGRNGSGKTTLMALLPRFYDPQEGRILIDGQDIRTVKLSSLRRQIGVVTQDSVIFPGTIAENIAYAMPWALRDAAGREAIISAARQAFAHDFIMEKPDGYDAVLGEHGTQLSGGQKQRLCIARAIMRQTPILILDEATSQVDAESEHLIQQAIESLMKQRTTFVIAHRFSTILSAGLIVVMDRGQIVGIGSHDELLAGCSTYRQLYERQLIGA